MFKKVFIGLLATATFSTVVFSGDLEDGIKEYEAGNLQKAAELYEKACNDGAIK